MGYRGRLFGRGHPFGAGHLRAVLLEGGRPVNERRIIDNRPTYWRLGDMVPVHAQSIDDVSPAWTGYDPSCGACWLGHAHTTDRHEASLPKQVPEALLKALY